jgi:multiple sugar transport system ATP-binding protein
MFAERPDAVHAVVGGQGVAFGLMAGVRLIDITKRFGDVAAVDGVSLDIADRDFMILLGPSGCGKSTLLRMIAGLEDPTEGQIWIGDRQVNDVLPKERDVAMVFQSYALYPHKTVQANIEFPLKVRGIDSASRAASAKEAAAMLGLSDYLGRKPGALSGGQRQRVALARAIVRQPAVFCMDEPLSNLDAKLRGETRAELTALHQRLDSTFVYVTHDQVEAMTMGTRIAVMSQGILQQVGTPQEIYDRPGTTFVATFLGTPPMNIFPAGSLEPGAHLVGVRPEHLTVADDGRLSVRVNLAEHLGHETLLTCSMNEDTRVVVRVPADEDVPAVGSQIRLDAWAHRRHHFDPATGRRIAS